MSLEKYFKEAEYKMKKAFDMFHHDLSAVRTGVASTALIDNIQVECYGSIMPLNQLAAISTPEPALIVAQPWDANNLTPIEKAIMKSDVGLMPNNDGKLIRINVPPLSEERRSDLIKVVKKRAEEARIATRNIRRDENDNIKKLEKAKEITEDDMREGISKIQNITDKYIAKVDEFLKRKEAELLKV